ncbi:F0F1 ATP synthase subunit B [Natroniella sulfidigena]|uniref:F0F1 ATP synthase subunit B n=1 Tax=Natroniella sulfidigena TaxID=723921 RepID=UPI002009E123|nr:F0F1 ATP synthase subunit B [Natroniella sulfidigena]
MISIDITFLFQLFNFVVLFLLLRHFLFEPMSNFMEERAQSISNKIDSAEQKQQAAQEIKEEYQQKLKEAKIEAQNIIEDSSRRAERVKEDIIIEAKEEANRKIKKAEEEIKRSKQQAVEDLKDEVATISIQIAKELIEQSIDDQMQEETISNYIEQLDEEKLGDLKC